MSQNYQKVIEVNQANFQQEVIQRSYQTPVVVDFWAPWCGPCRMLGPILERLANEPNSGFVLAKVNADHNPVLSSQYGVRGIPAVKAFREGRAVDEFVGAQPEPMVRQFMQRLTAGTRTNPAAGAPAADPLARLRQARQFLEQSKGCEARTSLQNFPTGPGYKEAQKLLPLANFLCDMGRGSSGGTELDRLYEQAADAVRRREYSTALYNLLGIVRQDKSYRQARPVIEGLFELIGENNALTQAYRQQMAAVLV